MFYKYVFFFVDGKYLKMKGYYIVLIMFWFVVRFVVVVSFSLLKESGRKYFVIVFCLKVKFNVFFGRLGGGGYLVKFEI